MHLKLCGDPEGSAADELVVLLEDDALGDVAVDDVHCEVEDLGPEPELLVDLDEEIDEVRLHVRLELGLELHADEVGHCDALERGSSLANGAASDGGTRKVGPTSMWCMCSITSSWYSSSKRSL